MRKKKQDKNTPTTKTQKISLDKQYQQELNKLYKEQQNIDKKKTYLNTLKEKIENNMGSKHNLGIEIKNLEQEISEIESGERINNFMFNTCHLVTNYIELNTNNNTETPENTTDILNQKREIVQKYNKAIGNEILEPHSLYIEDSFLCTKCQNLLEPFESSLVCSICGITKHTIEICATRSYKELQESNFKPVFTYLKQSHLSEHLRRIQGKENVCIPPELIQQVKLELQKEKITDTKDLTYHRMRNILKKLNKPKFYHSIPRIIYEITDIVPLQLSSTLEEKIINCFSLIVNSFEKHKGNRKSLISYPYILCKLFQMFGLHEYCRFFPTLKDPGKLRDHDEIFRKIVMDVSKIDPNSPWSFTPSI